MLYSTQLHPTSSREHLSPLGVNRAGMGEAPLLNRCFVDRVVINDSNHGWGAPNGPTRSDLVCLNAGRTSTSSVCLNAPKTKSKTKTKAKFGLGKGTFD